MEKEEKERRTSGKTGKRRRRRRQRNGDDRPSEKQDSVTEDRNSSENGKLAKEQYRTNQLANC